MAIETTDTLEQGRVKINAFGVYAAHTPTFTGFSSDPTGVTYRSTKIGNMCILYINMTGNGTSDADTFTITIPYTSANTAVQAGLIASFVNNNSTGTVPGRWVINPNTTTMSFFTTVAGAAWTATNGKRINNLILIYETA